MDFFNAHTWSWIMTLIVLLGCKPKSPDWKGYARPNILLIVADDLGFTDLGCYGGEINTPNLDGLARTGIRNTAFYTASTCSPTRAMLLTGVDNHRNGYGTMEGDWAANQKGVRGYEGHLNFDVVTFPKLLQDQGYHTSIAGKWHQAYPASQEDLWPDKRGFERSFCLLQGGAGHFSDQQRLFSFFDKTLYVEDGKYVDELPEDFYSSDFYTRKTIQFIQESITSNKPFFSMLTFTAPHWPLQVPDQYIDLYQGEYDAGYEALAQERLARAKQERIISPETLLPPLSPNVMPWDSLDSESQKVSSRIMEVYAAMVERLDVNVGRLFNYLKSNDLYNNTLIVFMSDNGAEGNSIWGISDTRDWVQANFDNRLENIGRKNSYVFTGPGWAQVSSLPFKWYKSFSSEGGVRSPMIISYPNLEDNFNKINHEYISVMDLAPTILEFTGIPIPDPDYQGRKIFSMDGISLLPWLEGRTGKIRGDQDFFCWELYGRRGVRKGKWKATWLEAPYGPDDWTLYDLATDPGELKDLTWDHPDTLQELKAAWDRYEKNYNVILPNEKVAYGTDDIWRE